MAGYTPLFSTLTTGTLCGKWPDIGLWPIVLSMADKHGVVDCTQAYIAGVTGLPVADVTACMRRFCEPDPGSRSDEYNGARLVLLDDHRDWGWRIVNHGIYREKARKAATQQEDTESGKDAERKRAERAAHKKESGDVQSRPAKSGADRPSYADANADSNPSKRVPSEPVAQSATERVFDHWRGVHRHPKASLDAKRRRLITAALKSYSEADLCQAISGYLNSPHHMGKNSSGTVYTGLDLLLRDAEHIDAGLKFYAEPPRSDLSTLTRRNVAATEDWEPPEVRHATN